MKTVIAFFLILLTGCATITPPAQPIEVKVPVAVPCRVTAPTRPAFAVDALAVGSSLWDQMAALTAERLQRIGYESELEAAVRSCQ